MQSSLLLFSQDLIVQWENHHKLGSAFNDLMQLAQRELGYDEPLASTAAQDRWLVLSKLCPQGNAHMQFSEFARFLPLAVLPSCGCCISVFPGRLVWFDCISHHRGVSWCPRGHIVPLHMSRRFVVANVLIPWQALTGLGRARTLPLPIPV